MSPSPGAPAPACRCGHERGAHLHFRRGTECSLCVECPRYRPVGGLLGRLRAWLAPAD